MLSRNKKMKTGNSPFPEHALSCKVDENIKRIKKDLGESSDLVINLIEFRTTGK